EERHRRRADVDRERRRAAAARAQGSHECDERALLHGFLRMMIASMPTRADCSSFGKKRKRNVAVLKLSGMSTVARPVSQSSAVCPPTPSPFDRCVEGGRLATVIPSTSFASIQ